MKILNIAIIFCILFIFSNCAIKTRSDIAREQEHSAVQSLQDVAANNQEAINQLEEQQGVLQGKMEEFDHKHTQEVSDQNKSLAELNKKMASFEEKLGNLEKSQEVLYEEVASLKKDNLEKPKKKDSFQAGEKAYKDKNFKDAEKYLNEFIEKNPKSKNFLKANYLLGDALYRQKKYNEAIIAYSVVHEKSMKTEMGRDSTLRIAQAFTKLNRKNDAKTFAKLLVDQFPDSKQAKKARKLLNDKTNSNDEG